MSASSAAAASKTTPAKNAAPSPRTSISTSASIGATAACPKVRATNKPTVTAHPSWREIIKECIATSDAPTRQGVSRHAIKKFAADKYKLNTPADLSHLKRAIIVGVDGGFFRAAEGGPSGCVKLASKVRTKSNLKENSKPHATTAESNAKTALKPVLKPTSNAKASAPETPRSWREMPPLNMHWRGYPRR
ncbi:hypothetical protein B0H14DRAFT_2868242 [Mycena olivaceomarginata]|nr:hypothetical protein B0H14DRAFT_2868242 [Mycena olivaceomarginata]